MDRPNEDHVGSGLRIGYFPFRPGLNPYQSLFANAVEGAGFTVDRIAPMKLLPLQRLARSRVDLFQLDWPHDWYHGRNAVTQAFKTIQYLAGLQHLRRRPLVWTAHNLQAHDARDENREHRMIQHLIDRCDGIIVMSPVARELLECTYALPRATRVAVIPHGHFIDVYPNRISRAEARDGLSIDSAARVALSFGRIAPYKGTTQLISAFGAISRPGDILLIAGEAADPSFVDHLRTLAKDMGAQRGEIRIVAETIAPEHVQRYFNACDVVALPFEKILNSGSLLLAMSFGKCVVAPIMGSIPETVCPEGWFPFDTGVPGALASSLQRALACNDREAREATILGFTKGRYGWDQIGEAVGSLYRQCV